MAQYKSSGSQTLTSSIVTALAIGVTFDWVNATVEA